jgi:hypothetical protein
METSEEQQNPTDSSDSLDVLDTTKWTPSPRQLITCVICDQKFTNKVK